MESQGEALWRFSENGIPVAEVGKFVNNRFTIEGTTYLLSRNALRPFALIGDHGPVVTAEWTGTRKVAGTIIADWQGSRFFLRRPREGRDEWELQHNNEPAGFIRRRWGTYTADLAPGLPLAVRAFLLYVTGMHGTGAGPYGEGNHPV